VKVILMRFARVAVMETLSRAPRMAQQGASAAIEGKKCPYFLGSTQNPGLSKNGFKEKCEQQWEAPTAQ
jgi:hypothetical protein